MRSTSFFHLPIALVFTVCRFRNVHSLRLASSAVEHELQPKKNSNQIERRLGAENAPALCTSVVAVAGTRDPEYYNESRSHRFLQSDGSELDLADEESFVCETEEGYINLVGTDDQLASLRRSLNSGELVSAEMTIVGLTIQDNIPEEGGDVTSEAVLPPESDGSFVFQPSVRRRNLGERQERKLATYEGTKQVLAGMKMCAFRSCMISKQLRN